MKTSIFLCAILYWYSASLWAQEGIIMTVNGPIAPSDMGITLIHEHVLVDFIGADSTGNHRWNRPDVIQVALPYLKEIKKWDVQTFVECTPAYIGRDPLLLRELSQSTEINFITNTGYYGAADNKFLPAHAHSESAEQLAKRWVVEWEKGINGTDVRPGFIKIGVQEGPLSDLHVKLITAAAKAHQQTGMTIASHTGSAVPAFEQLEVLEREGVSAKAFIWVHAQSESDYDLHVEAARKGAWVSLDGLNDSNVEAYLKMIVNLKQQGFLHKTLVSHDAGWYSPGEKNGGNFRGYTTLFDTFIPLLKQSNFTEEDLQQLLILNPRNAFEIRIRKKE